MSLLWKNAAAFQHESMAWHVAPGEEHIAQHAKSVRHAGFAGYVGREADEDDYGEEQSHGDGLWEDSSPEPTSSQQRHYEEHDEYPDSYHDAHEEAYARAQDAKNRENIPDYEDDPLHQFVAEHGTNTDHWKQHATYGAVNLKQPVYATQSHVSQAHIDKYHHDPGAMSHHQQKYNPHGDSEYLGDGAPMFVTHEGRLHATEGHHRTAAALQRGDDHIMGWHYDADKHGFPDEEGHMPDHPDYYDPYE